MSRRTIHCVSHVDYDDASMVVTICGDVYHVNDPDSRTIGRECVQRELALVLL